MIADQTGEWMEADDLEKLRDMVRRGEEKLNRQLKKVGRRYARLISDAYAIIDQNRPDRGCFLDQIPRPATDARLKRKAASPDPMADVVFVHGLDGGAYSTWQDETRLPLDSWPFWLAKDLPHVNFWTLGYPAASSRRSAIRDSPLRPWPRNRSMPSRTRGSGGAR